MRRIVNDPLSALALIALLLVAGIGLHGALEQVGKNFPGFLLMRNRVVASVGLSIWPGTVGGEIYQHQVTSIDGVAVHDAEQVRRRVRALPAGTPLRYELHHRDGARVRTIEVRSFGWRDFSLLYGLYLVNGLCLGAAGLVALRRRRSPAARACAPLLLIGSAWVLSAMDLYGPHVLFRLHALCEALLAPAALSMALAFPEPAACLERRPWLPRVPYVAAAGLAIFYQLGIEQAGVYGIAHLLAINAFGFSLAALLVSGLERLRRPLPDEARARLRAVVAGFVFALSLPILLTFAELLTGGRAPQNALALTGALFPLVLCYALLRGGIDEPTPARV